MSNDLLWGGYGYLLEVTHNINQFFKPYLNFLKGLLPIAFFKGGGDVTNCWATCWATNWELSLGFLEIQNTKEKDRIELYTPWATTTPASVDRSWRNLSLSFFFSIFVKGVKKVKFRLWLCVNLIAQSLFHLGN